MTDSEVGVRADNDNTRTEPKKAEEFGSDLAARRLWLATLPDKASAVLAWPTFERLAHLGNPVKLGAQIRWRDMTAPARIMTAANDNDPDAPEEAVEGDDVDLAREVRPSVPELLKAIDWTVTGKERWHHTRRMVQTFAVPDVEVEPNFGLGDEKHIIRLGNLAFNFDPARRRQPGLLVEYGITAKGKPLRPVDRTRAQKGAKPAKRSAAAIAAYLKRPAAIPSPMAAEGVHKPMCGQRGAGMYAPLAGVEAARADLVKAGVDGSVPIEELPFPATRCPDYTVPGPQWKGGVSAIKGSGGEGFTTAPDIGQHATEMEIARTADLAILRQALGEHAAVLDMAVTDSTAEEIAVAVGYAQSSAKKYGAKLVDTAIQKYLALAA
ncbi:MAG: hypothetical protein EOS75_03815 [Mesorhizobium sp.]|nr:MAG: hypothetical protein EOS74_08260 [Mesorhizobium sp.]RWD58846.1 MAG: hypothetical protein EOS75_03815 [Mesorhizobium sp.]